MKPSSLTKNILDDRAKSHIFIEILNKIINEIIF